MDCSHTPLISEAALREAASQHPGLLISAGALAARRPGRSRSTVPLWYPNPDADPATPWVWRAPHGPQPATPCSSGLVGGDATGNGDNDSLRVVVSDAAAASDDVSHERRFGMVLATQPFDKGLVRCHVKMCARHIAEVHLGLAREALAAGMVQTWWRRACVVRVVTVRMGLAPYTNVQRAMGPVVDRAGWYLPPHLAARYLAIARAVPKIIRWYRIRRFMRWRKAAVRIQVAWRHKLARWAVLSAQQFLVSAASRSPLRRSPALLPPPLLSYWVPLHLAGAIQR